MGKLWINKLSKPHFIAYDVRDLDDNPYIAKARKTLPVITWTVNSAEKLERAKKLADWWRAIISPPTSPARSDSCLRPSARTQTQRSRTRTPARKN